MGRSRKRARRSRIVSTTDLGAGYTMGLSQGLTRYFSGPYIEPFQQSQGGTRTAIPPTPSPPSSSPPPPSPPPRPSQAAYTRATYVQDVGNYIEPFQQSQGGTRTAVPPTPSPPSSPPPPSPPPRPSQAAYTRATYVEDVGNGKVVILTQGGSTHIKEPGLPDMVFSQGGTMRDVDHQATSTGKPAAALREVDEEDEDESEEDGTTPPSSQQQQPQPPDPRAQDPNWGMLAVSSSDEEGDGGDDGSFIDWGEQPDLGSTAAQPPPPTSPARTLSTAPAAAGVAPAGSPPPLSPPPLPCAAKDRQRDAAPGLTLYDHGFASSRSRAAIEGRSEGIMQKWHLADVINYDPKGKPPYGIKQTKGAKTNKFLVNGNIIKEVWLCKKCGSKAVVDPGVTKNLSLHSNSKCKK